MPNRDCFQLLFSTPRMLDNSDEAEIMLYGGIVEDYSKFWKEQYPEDKSASDFDKAIKKIKADGAKKLLLRINSPGGIVTQAIAMRTILTSAGFEQITVRIEGLCASAATFLATVPGAHVQMGEGSEYMIHNPWGGCWGSAEDMENFAHRLRNIEQTSRGFYAAKSGQSDEQIKTWMDAETWFTAREALDYGFADELLEAKAAEETPAAACVTSSAMAVMRSLYHAVPDSIAVKNTAPDEEDGSTGEITNQNQNGAPVAGVPSEIKNEEENPNMPNMEISEITLDQLRTENPALFNEINQSAVDAERDRVSTIDALTLPGYEELAEQAKANGTSALDFQKQIVTAQKQKKATYLQQRQTETGQAVNVTGGSPANNQNEDQEIQSFAKEMAAYASECSASPNGNMY